MGVNRDTQPHTVRFGTEEGGRHHRVHRALRLVAAVITFGFTIGFEEFMWNLTVPMIKGGSVLTPVSGYLVTKIPRNWLGILIGVWLTAFNMYGLLC